MLGYLKLQQLVVPAGPMIAGSALNIVAFMAWRIFFSRVLLRKMRSERVIFLGDSPMVQEIVSHLGSASREGTDPVRISRTIQTLPAARRLGAISDLREVVDRLHPQRIVVGLRERRSSLPVAQLLDLRLSGIRIEDALSTYEMAFERISTQRASPLAVNFQFQRTGPQPDRRASAIGLLDDDRGAWRRWLRRP